MYKDKKVTKEYKDVLNKPIYFSESNRITYVYRKSISGNVILIVCVSFDIYIKRKWKTVLYYDNVHGYLHRHDYFSLNRKSESIISENIKQKGTQNSILRWCIKDILTNYVFYKKKFLKNSGFNETNILSNLY